MQNSASNESYHKKFSNTNFQTYRPATQMTSMAMPEDRDNVCSGSHKYDTELKTRGVKKIVKIGIAFSAKKLQAKHEIIEL